MFPFCWENKFLNGQSTKIFSVKTGFEEVKKKANKHDGWYFGLLVAIYKKPKDQNMRWTGQISKKYVLTETMLIKYFQNLVTDQVHWPVGKQQKFVPIGESLL